MSKGKTFVPWLNLGALEAQQEGASKPQGRVTEEDLQASARSTDTNPQTGRGELTARKVELIEGAQAFVEKAIQAQREAEARAQAAEEENIDLRRRVGQLENRIGGVSATAHGVGAGAAILEEEVEALRENVEDLKRQLQRERLAAAEARGMAARLSQEREPTTERDASQDVAAKRSGVLPAGALPGTPTTARSGEETARSRPQSTAQFLKEEIQDLRQRIATFEAERFELQRQTIFAEERATDATAKLKAAERVAVEAQAGAQRARERADAAEQSLIQARESTEATEKQIAELQRVGGQQSEEIQGLRRRLNTEEVELKSIKRQYNEARDAVRAATDRATSVEQDVVVERQRLQSIQDIVEQLTTELTAAREDAAQIAEAAKENARASEQAVTAARRELAEAQARAESAEKNAADARTALTMAQTEAETARQSVASMEKDIAATRVELQRLRAEGKDRGGRIEELEKHLREVSAARGEAEAKAAQVERERDEVRTRAEQAAQERDAAVAQAAASGQALTEVSERARVAEEGAQKIRAQADSETAAIQRQLDELKGAQERTEAERRESMEEVGRARRELLERAGTAEGRARIAEQARADADTAARRAGDEAAQRLREVQDSAARELTVQAARRQAEEERERALKELEDVRQGLTRHTFRFQLMGRDFNNIREVIHAELSHIPRRATDPEFAKEVGKSVNQILSTCVRLDGQPLTPAQTSQIRTDAIIGAYQGLNQLQNYQELDEKKKERLREMVAAEIVDHVLKPDLERVRPALKKLGLATAGASIGYTSFTGLMGEALSYVTRASSKLLVQGVARSLVTPVFWTCLILGGTRAVSAALTLRGVPTEEKQAEIKALIRSVIQDTQDNPQGLTASVARTLIAGIERKFIGINKEEIKAVAIEAAKGLQNETEVITAVKSVTPHRGYKFINDLFGLNLGGRDGIRRQ